MKIEPGYYKIKRKGRYLGTTYHYLRVMRKGKKKLYQIDSAIPQEGDDYEANILDEYILVKRITHNSPIQVKNPSIEVKWHDEDNDEFKMKARNAFAFLNIFKQFPRVARAFGFGKDHKLP